MLLSEKDRSAIRARLKSMANPVRLVHFTQTLECARCSDALRLLTELAELSDKLSLQVLNLRLGRKRAAQYGIDRAPATLVHGEKDYGIHIFGLPAGYEFAVLIEDILLASRKSSGLDAKFRAALEGLRAPVRVQVFSTPDCPYCPGMAILTHQMAIENQLVTAELYDATEVPDLVRRHGIRGVPKTIINGSVAMDGAVPPAVLLDAVLRAASPKQIPVQC